MDAQTIIAGLIVAGCAGYLIRRWVRAWKGKVNCECQGRFSCPHASRPANRKSNS